MNKLLTPFRLFAFGLACFPLSAFIHDGVVAGIAVSGASACAGAILWAIYNNLMENEYPDE